MIAGDLLEFAGAFPDAILLLAADGKVLGANRAACDLIAQDGFAGEPSLGALVSDPAEKISAFVRGCFRSRETTVAVLEFRGRSGPVACRCEGALAQSARNGSGPIALVRALRKDTANTPFAALTSKVEALNREVGERKKVEADLSLQRRLLQTTLSSIGDAVIATDCEGRITFLNAVAEQLTGWQGAEAIGAELARVFEIVNESTREPVENPVDKVFRERGIVGLANHTVLIAKDGREIPIADSGAPIRDLDGTIHGVVLVFRDVTDLRQAGEELRLSEERFRTVADAAPVLIWQAGIDMLRYYFNKQWLDYRGRSLEQELGNGWMDGVHPEDLQLCWSRYSNAYVTRRPFQMEYRLRRWDGQYHWILASGLPTFHPSGTFDGFIGTCIDIDDRKRIEAELALNAQRFRVALQGSPISVFNQDTNLRYTWTYNNAAELGQDLLLGRTDSELFPNAIGQRLMAIKQEVLTSGAGQQFEIAIPMEASERTYDTTVEPLRNAEGQIVGITGASVDVTERKLAEGHLLAQAKELARSNADLQQFAYITSHDLQEPLRMIGSYAQLIEKRYQGRLDDNADEFIRYIVQGADRMRTLINDLLMFSKLGNADRAMQRVALDSAIHWALMNLEGAVRESGAEVSFSGLPEVRGDQVQLVQLFQNLIANAIKYRGPEPLRIQITADASGPEWILSVSDNGIGIDAAYHERIFGLFKRLHGQEVPGTGIGLAICRKIVENHGGRIWVESAVGRGATFRFSLPGVQQAGSF